MQANIFKIEKKELDDGSGMVTRIYFKGCPLRCVSCSSPQYQNRPTQILWDSKRCLFCRLCEGNCPSKSLHFTGNSLHFQADTCDACRICIRSCPSRALHFVGKMMELDEITDMLLADQNLYGAGGVFLTGGDALMQPEFAAALLKVCREHGIHTCVDTTGFSQPLAFAKILAHTDHLFLNIKHYSEKKHVQFTGVSNQTILENLNFAIAAGIAVTVRITITPGLNDTFCDAQKFAQLLKEHRVERVFLSVYSQEFARKYEDICQSAPHFCSSLTPGFLEKYADVIRGYGLDVVIGV